MDILLTIVVAVGVVGLSAVTLARPHRERCPACTKGKLAIDPRSFALVCPTCGAQFRRDHGVLVPRAPDDITPEPLPRAVARPRREET